VADVTDVFEHLVVDDAGGVRLVGTDLEIIEDADPLDLDGLQVAHYWLGQVAVNTATPLSASLLNTEPIAEQATPYRMEGSDGWTLSGEDGWHAVVWQATPNAVVTVSGATTIERLTEIAKSLEIVDEATWEAAFPDFADGRLAASSEDPAGPLYVLSAEASRWTLVNGWRGSSEPSTDGPRPIRLVIVGRPDGEGFVDPIPLRLSEPSDVVPDVPVLDAPVVDADGVRVPAETEWSSRTLDSGEVLVAEGETVIAMAAQHNGRWLQAQVERDREAALVEVFEHVVVEDDETVHLRAGSGLEVVDDVRIEAAAPQVDTYAEVEGARVHVVVETATAASPLGAAGTADRVVPLSGNVWSFSRDDVEATSNAIGWQAAPNRAVFVSGELPVEELRAIAESLEIVDEATWESAFPDASELSTD
jgi:hypothetical protein